MEQCWTGCVHWWHCVCVTHKSSTCLHLVLQSCPHSALVLLFVSHHWLDIPLFHLGSSPVSSASRNTLDFNAHHLHFLLFICYRTVVAAFSLTPASHLTEVLECIFISTAGGSCPQIHIFAYCFLAVRLCLALSLYTSSDLSHALVGIQNMLKSQYLSPLILC